MRVIARLPAPLAHAAGRGARRAVLRHRRARRRLDGQRAAIWAIDPRAPRPRRAGRLPVALSDLAAVSRRATGVASSSAARDPRGRVHDELWRLATRAHGRVVAAVATPGRCVDRRDVYAADRPGLRRAAVAHDPARVYVPNSRVEHAST